jgi:hypothetical protein
MTILFGVFLILHGFVHLLYLGQAARIFELKPGMVWPGGAWMLSRVLGDDSTRIAACVVLALAALAFVAAGIGVFTGPAWRRPVIVGAAVFSSVVYLALWNGRAENLDGQGAIGILINAAILAAVLVLRWPSA